MAIEMERVISCKEMPQNCQPLFHLTNYKLALQVSEIFHRLCIFHEELRLIFVNVVSSTNRVSTRAIIYILVTLICREDPQASVL